MKDKNLQHHRWTNTSRQVAWATKLYSVILMARIFHVATKFSGISVVPCTTKHGIAA